MVGCVNYVRESVVHVLWECPVYDSTRNIFIVELEKLLGESFKEFY